MQLDQNLQRAGEWGVNLPQPLVLRCPQNPSRNRVISKIPRRIKETSKALKLHRDTVDRIVKKGFVRKIKRRENLKTRVKLSGVDNDRKSLIRLTVYDFYHEKIVPTLDNLYGKLIQISKGTHYEFRYKRTSLYHLVRKLGFNIRNVINVALSWKVWNYLLEIAKYRAQNYLIVY